MKKLITAALLFCLTLGNLPAIAASQSNDRDLNADVYMFTKSEQATLKQIEAKLNQITTLQSRFKQTNADGSEVMGTFYLSRPGKMRIEYDPPIKNFIVATGTFLVYWDDEMQQQSHTTIGSSLADIILRKEIRFGERLKLCGFETKGQLYKVCLTDSENQDQGTFSLFLDKTNFTLKQWTVEDLMGKLTTVNLLDPHYNVSFNDSIFRFTKPQQ
ncbi:MAG: outer membrane lipoprotein carrier protein LolA [Alphaproteobacteria bacterium]|nr:outer membrane lipoprotein carrier protein LolA [Alphaproteobacteria bacterium]MBP9876775.1 outer membrane lipoprotein carrier protein LolA [Alphaproteobacteria bacterium]